MGVQVVAHDNYNRADSTTIGPGDVGPTPTQYNGTGGTQIFSNKVASTGSGTRAVLYDVGVTDVECQITITGAIVGPMVRATDQNNGWILWGNPGVDGLYYVNAGSLTKVTSTGQTFVSGDVVKLRVVGNVFTGYRNGVRYLSYVDSSNLFATNTKSGMWFNGSTSADDLTINSVSYLAHDDYNRLNSTTIGRGDAGPVPTEYGSDITISSNQLAPSTTSPTALIYDTGHTDAACTAVVGATTTAPGNAGPIVRSDGASNGWYLMGSPLSIVKLVSGTATTMATSAVSPAAGDALQLTAVGNVYTGYQNGVQVVQYTDGSGANATLTGQGAFFSGDTAARIDEVSVEVPVTTPVQSGAVAMSASGSMTVAGTVTPAVSAAVSMVVATTTLAVGGTVTHVQQATVSMAVATVTLTVVGVRDQAALAAMSVALALFSATATGPGVASGAVAMSAATSTLTAGAQITQPAVVVMSVSASSMTAAATTTSSGTVVVLDDYNRANSTTIGAGSIGPAPTEVAGDLAIVSNEVVANTSALAILTYETLQTDVLVETTVGSTDSFFLNVIVRCNADASTYWVLSCTWDGTLDISLFDAGAFHSHATADIGAGPAVGDVFAFKAVGDVFTGYLNGTQVITYTDASHTGATNTTHGFGFSASSTSAVTNLQITGYGTPVSPPATVSMTATSTLTASVVGSVYVAAVVMSTTGTMTVGAQIVTVLTPIEDIVTTYTVDGMLTLDAPVATPPTGRAPLDNPTVAPTLTNTGSGNLAAGTYDYAYEWWQFDPTRTTAFSPVASITVGANSEVTITVPSNVDADGYVLWRRPSGGTMTDWRML